MPAPQTVALASPVVAEPQNPAPLTQAVLPAMSENAYTNPPLPIEAM